MSDWLLLTRTVHAAGGALAPAKLREFDASALTRARARGLLEPGASGRQDLARITPLGKLAATGRVVFRVEPGASTGHLAARPALAERGALDAGGASCTR